MSDPKTISGPQIYPEYVEDFFYNVEEHDKLPIRVDTNLGNAIDMPSA